MVSIFSYDLSITTLLLLFLVAFFVGMAKAGVHGAAMFSPPILALYFGGKSSSGLMLPLLLMADIFAVLYYHRFANWYFLKKLFPWAALGVVVGTIIGNVIDDQMFKHVMAVIVFVSLAIMIWMEVAGKERVPDYFWFAATMGLLGGITTMVGNLAGSVMALYLLSMRLPKNEYIGTSAWFFLVINIFKVPFHIFAWQSITLNSFFLDLICLPFIALGVLLGILFVKRIGNTQYRWFILGMTGLAAVFLVV